MKLKKFNEQFEDDNYEGNSIRYFKGNPADFLADMILEQGEEYILGLYPHLGEDSVDDPSDSELMVSGIVDYDYLVSWSEEYLKMLRSRTKEYLKQK